MSSDMAFPPGHHPTARQLRDRIHGVPTAADTEVSGHLDTCVACRVWMRRLEHFDDAAPSDDIISTLVAAAPSVPPLVLTAVAQATRPEPAVGDLWRVGTSDIILVWIRKIIDEGVYAAVPVLFDVDLADDLTLIADGDTTNLGIDTAFLVGVEGHVDGRALIDRIGAADVTREIEALRDYRRGGPAPGDVPTGTRLEMPDDQRIEFHQLVADILADSGPDSFALEESEHEAGEIDLGTFAAELDELTWGSPDLEITEREPRGETIDETHHYFRIAVVQQVNVAVAVSAIIGPDADAKLATERVISLIRRDLNRERADCVAVVVNPTTFDTAIREPVDVADRVIDVEADSATPPAPEDARLPLADAIRKYLDRHVTPWSDVDSVTGNARVAVDLGAVAMTATANAATAVVAEGRRARTAEKRTRYLAVNGAEVQAAITLVTELLGGADPSEAVREFTESLPR